MSTQLTEEAAPVRLPRATPRRGGWRVAKRVGWTVVYLVALIAIWDGYVRIEHVQSYLLPAPGSVWNAFRDLVRSGQLWPNLSYTVRNIVVGFVGGSVIGILLGWGMSLSRLVHEVLAPYLVLLQAAPKIAVAPLLVLWFGLNLTSQFALILVLVFFPMMLSTLLGLSQAEPDVLALGRVLSLSRWQTLARIQLPAAMPALFAGAKIAIVDAMTGAFLAEYLSAQKGLGYLMVLGNTSYNSSLLVAAVVLTVLVGLAGFGLLGLAERVVLRWRN